MPILQALVLGVVQGLTEFLPVSSSGHLVIVPALFNWHQPGVAYDVLLHVGSLIALLIYFSGEILAIIRGLFVPAGGSRRLLVLLIVGSIPAAIFGLLLKDVFAQSFTDAPASAIELVITGVILVAAELILAYHLRRSSQGGGDLRHMENMTLADAGLVGIAQAIAIIPGISRSGSTIGTGLALKITRDDAARFSFLLSIPALLGATLVEIPDMSKSNNIGLATGIAGFVASLIVSYVAIAGLIRYLKTHTLYPFAAYCVVAGLIFYLLVR